MAAATTALLVGAAMTAGATAYSANEAGKQADAANKDAKRGRQSADQILAEAAGRTLELPEFNAVDTVGDYVPQLIDLYGELQDEGTRARYNQILDEYGGIIQRSFGNDLSASREMLDDVFGFSREQQNLNAQLVDESFDLQGLTGARDAAISGLEGFLNFQLPEAARREINRTTLETGYATGTVGSSLQGELAGQLTSAQMTQNFFNAIPQYQNLVAQNNQIYQPGLDRSRLPQAGTSLSLELANLDQINQAGLLNYQNRLNQEIQRYQNDMSTTLSNFQRKDDFDMLRANIQTDRANASQATANAATAAGNQAIMQGFQTAGQLVMMAGSSGRPAGTGNTPVWAGGAAGVTTNGMTFTPGYI